MCGIAGFVDARRTWNAERLTATGAAMAATLSHRGPDDSGVWVDPVAGVSLAHRRLAILDLSPAGRQPMVSSCGRLAMIFNGEIYNYRELRHELETTGQQFRGQSDSEVLVEACAHWGVATTLKRLNGMFAFAVWDRNTRTLFLARDRIGIKPLYWARLGSLFLFGSELKALRAHAGWVPEIDSESLRTYMRWGHVPAPDSIYQNVHKLLPGELLAFGSNNEPELSSYWNPAQVIAAAQADRLKVGEAEAVGSLEDLLRDAVGRQMVADVPLGAFLSGGIDSSLVVALMQAQSSRAINTFTIGFGEKQFDEAACARAVADHLGTSHTEFQVSPADALDLVPELPRWFDEPLANRSAIPTLMVSALARRQVTVALSGDGGDELFGGYKAHYTAASVAQAIRFIPGPLRSMAADMVDGLVAGARALLGVLPAHSRPALSLNKVGQIAAVVRASGDVNALYGALRNATLAPSALFAGARERAVRWLAAEHAELVPDTMERMGYFDLISLLVDSILTKVDRSSMAHSLEVRVPLLDHRVVEFAWRLPPALKYGRKAESKRLLRSILYRHVPRELVDRPKRGFACPIAIWLRGPLRPWAEELLAERHLKENGHFDGARVHACWNEHLRGTSDHWRLLWGVLMFEQWRRHWDIAPAGADRNLADWKEPSHRPRAESARLLTS